MAWKASSMIVGVGQHPPADAQDRGPNWPTSALEGPLIPAVGEPPGLAVTQTDDRVAVEDPDWSPWTAPEVVRPPCS